MDYGGQKGLKPPFIIKRYFEVKNFQTNLITFKYDNIVMLHSILRIVYGSPKRFGKFYTSLLGDKFERQNLDISSLTYSIQLLL